jgi:hypothetical protein
MIPAENLGPIINNIPTVKGFACSMVIKAFMALKRHPKVNSMEGKTITINNHQC